ncbi:MAG: hypothetical protein V3U80_00485 [Flavobacteriaceae bacterium]
MKTITTFVLSLFTLFLFAQTGPGGVGSTDGTSDLEFWYAANTETTYSNGSLVNSMTDLSGNNKSLSAAGNERPSFATASLNNYETILFDGNDELENTHLGNCNENMSFGFIFKSTNTTTADDVMLQHGGRNSFVIRGSTDVYSDYIGAQSHQGSAYTTGSWQLHIKRINNTVPDIRFYESGIHTDTFGNPVENRTSNTWIGGNGPGGGTGLNGNMAECFKFSKVINITERKIIENYLTAKYGLPLAQGDFYKQDDASQGNFDHNVAGIGQNNGADNHTDSQGTGIIRINTPSTISNGDYLFWGEETKDAIYDFSTTAVYTEQLNSKWRVDKRNNLGTVTLSVKASDLDLSAMISCAELKLIVSSDANFTAKTSYDLSLSGGIYTATAVNFTDADYFTFEYFDTIVVDDTQFYNGSGFNNVPNTSDGCYKLLVKNTSDGLLPLTQGANVREVEVETGGILVVNDGLRLLVENGIQLDGEIRLIGDSQLIQTHTGTSQVTGSGKLYVDKASNLTDVFQSGYWTSPVTTSGNTFTISDAMKDGTTPTSATSTPLDITFITGHDGATGTPISISNFWLNKFVDTVDWYPNGTAVDETTSFNPTEGYNMKSSGANGQNFTFVGKPNDGDYTSTVTSGNSSLLGNPYPSSLDADTFLLDNGAASSQALFTTLYFWDGINDNSTTHVRNSYLGGYATRAIGLGTNYNGGDTPTRYISVGQGFFVDAIASGTVLFKNTQRAFTNTGASNVPPFFSKTSSFPILRIGFEFDIDNSNTFHRQLAVGFRGLTDDFDAGYDAIMYDMRPTDMSLIVNNHSSEFTITGIEDFTEDAIEIPLHVKLDQQRDVIFEIDSIENFAPNNIYLKDAFTNIYHDLTNPISLNLPTGDYTNRFSITFRNSPLSVDNLVTVNDILIADEINNLKITSFKNTGIKKVTIFNVLGQTLVAKNTSNSIVNLPVSLESGQVLLISLELENGQKLTKKLIKK